MRWFRSVDGGGSCSLGSVEKRKDRKKKGVKVVSKFDSRHVSLSGLHREDCPAEPEREAVDLLLCTDSSLASKPPAMNWTGDRLRRHSNNNKSASISKIQKQNFAKSRKKPPKDIKPELPFHAFSQFRQARRDDGDASGPTQQVRACRMCSFPSLTLAKSNATTANHLQSQSSSQRPTLLDHIKRQLLDADDWAAVSAARPLQMLFTPVEEIEKFGKRRPLTDADRNRLADRGREQAGELAIPRPKGRRHIHEMRAIGDIDIRINGVPAGKDCGVPFNGSSQSMLLDYESSHPEYVSPGLHRNQGRSRSLTRLSTSTRPATSVRSTALPSPSPVVELTAFNLAQNNNRRFTNSLVPRRRSLGLIETSSAFSGYSSVPQAMESPVRRRFTIDEQAEQEGLLNSPTISGTRNLSHLSVDNKSTMLYMQTQSPATQSIGSNQYSPWLPQPKRNIQRVGDGKSGETSTFLAPAFPTPHYDPSHFSQIVADSMEITRDRQFTSPAKIYGQSIILDGNSSPSRLLFTQAYGRN